MLIAKLIGLFCAGSFFGAAIYISVAQHPAALEAGPSIGGRFFPPMYRRASALQISLCIVGTLAGITVWLLGGGATWLVGSAFLVSVIPITLIFIKPINDQLLDPSHDPDSTDTESLLQQWGPRHWVRSIVSGIAFILFLVAHGSA